MLSLIARLLRLVSVVICLIVAASFLIFVVEQTSSASTEQQEALGGHRAPANAPAGSGKPTLKHQSTLHKKIDEASNEFTSPFSSITSGSSSQWAIRGVNLLLTLLIYGFVLSFLARAIRVRA